jgi:hypothetical protein
MRREGAMAEGIRIHDADLEITEAGLAALTAQTGLDLVVRRLDASLSAAALGQLLGGAPGPDGAQPEPAAPQVEVTAGRLLFQGERAGRKLRVEVNAAGLDLRFTAEGLRVTTHTDG